MVCDDCGRHLPDGAQWNHEGGCGCADCVSVCWGLCNPTPRKELRATIARLTRERDEARAELDKREQTFSDWLDRAKAAERARVVAIVEREGEGEAMACEMHARALTDRGRVPVRSMHEAAAGVARTVVHRVKVSIEAGERDK